MYVFVQKWYFACCAVGFTYIEYRDFAFVLYIHRDPIYVCPGSLGYVSNRIVFYVV